MRIGSIFHSSVKQFLAGQFYSTCRKRGYRLNLDSFFGILPKRLHQIVQIKFENGKVFIASEGAHPPQTRVAKLRAAGLRATDCIAGCGSQIAGCGLRATLRLRAAGHRLWAADCGPHSDCGLGHRLRAADCCVAGCGPQIAGCHMLWNVDC